MQKIDSYANPKIRNKVIEEINRIVEDISHM